jgi:flagellar biosynthesis/type III secretory pathway chaperone
MVRRLTDQNRILERRPEWQKIAEIRVSKLMRRPQILMSTLTYVAENRLTVRNEAETRRSDPEGQAALLDKWTRHELVGDEWRSTRPMRTVSSPIST